MRRRPVGLAVVVALAAACGGPAADYATYEDYYHRLEYFRDATGAKYSAEEFDDYAERTCGRDAEDLGRQMGEDGDPTSTYFLIRLACGEETADDALNASDQPERSKRYLSRDFENAAQVNRG